MDAHISEGSRRRSIIKGPGIKGKNIARPAE